MEGRREDSASCTENVFEGYLDGIEDGRILGWAWLSNLPNDPISVDFYVDGNHEGTVVAGQYRVDLETAEKGNGRHAFELRLPEGCRDGKPHSIRLCYHGTNTDLYGSPEMVCFERKTALGHSATGPHEHIQSGERGREWPQEISKDMLTPEELNHIPLLINGRASVAVALRDKERVGITPIVQSLWIGGSLPPIQHLSIRSFLEHGHEYQLYAYEEIDGVPTGTTVCDASTILPRESIFCYQDGFGKGSYSAFSNLFRYKLIFEKGGWWVDTDVVCLKAFDFDDEFVFATEREEDDTSMAASCVFKSPAKSEYLGYCLQVCDAKDKARLRWGEIGPHLLNDAIKRFNLTSHLVPVHVFNPINHFEFTEILRSDFDVSRLKDSYAVHLWNERWRSENIDPDDDAHPQSLYALFKKRYLSSTTWDIDSVSPLKRKVEFQRACLEDMQRSLTQAEKERDECQLALRNAQQEVLGLRNSLTDAQQEILGLRNSMSWKITAPLRSAYDTIARATSTTRGKG